MIIEDIEKGNVYHGVNDALLKRSSVKGGFPFIPLLRLDAQRNRIEAHFFIVKLLLLFVLAYIGINICSASNNNSKNISDNL